MTPTPVSEFAIVAADYVRQSIKMELDGSVESLAFVDHYLSKVGTVSDRIMDLVSSAIGCYFGEVVISRLGGAWHIEGEEPSGWTVTIEAAPLRFRPVAMAAEAIRKADLEDYDTTLVAPSAYEAELADALSMAPPVEADYYYSLTGRLETIEHAAALLAEIIHRKEEAVEPGQN